MGKKKAAGRRRRNTTKTENYRVFISHATYDKWTATVICEKIEAKGATTFRDDRGIEGGDSIPVKIIDAIRDSQEVLVLLTPESIQRPWVIAEIGIAMGLGRRIVPLLHHIPSEDIPDLIRDRKAIDLNDLSQYLKELVERANNR